MFFHVWHSLWLGEGVAVVRSSSLNLFNNFAEVLIKQLAPYGHVDGVEGVLQDVVGVKLVNTV